MSGLWGVTIQRLCFTHLGATDRCVPVYMCNCLNIAGNHETCAVIRFCTLYL